MNIRSHSPDIPKPQDYNADWNMTNNKPIDYENASNFAREPEIVQSQSSPFNNTPIESFVINQKITLPQNQPIEDELI